jgi:hypothetical protein
LGVFINNMLFFAIYTTHSAWKALPLNLQVLHGANADFTSSEASQERLADQTESN